MSKAYSFDTPSSILHQHYKGQEYLRGGFIPVFSGATRQRGYGLGGVFTRLFRSFAPTIKTVAKAAGKQLLKSGANFASDLIDGEKVSTAAVKSLSSGGKNLLKTLTADISGGKKGGVKRKLRVNHSKGNKRVRRQGKRDIFS